MNKSSLQTLIWRSLDAYALASNRFGRAGIEALASTDFLSHIEALELYSTGALEDDAIRALLDSPIDNLLELELTGMDERLSRASVEAIANCPRLRKLENLDLQYSLTTDEQIEILAASPYLTNLREFSFDLSAPDEPAGVGLEGLRALGQSPIVRNVLTYAPTFTGGVEDGLEDKVALILAESPSFTGLRRLMLTYCLLTPAGMEALAGAAHLATVTDLDLDDNPVGDEGVRFLLDAPFAPNLLRLNLNEVGLSAAGAREVASGKWGQLRYLNVSKNAIGPEGFAAIVHATSLDELRELWAQGCRLGQAGAAALANTTRTRLQTISLSHNRIGVKGAKKLAASSSLREVGWLEVGSNGLGAKGVQALLASPLAGSLRRLGLNDNGIRDEGARYVAESATFANLSVVDLSDNGITDEGAQALAKSPHLQEAREVWLGGNQAITLALRPPFAR